MMLLCCPFMGPQQYDEVIPGRCLDGVKMSDVKIYCSYEKKLLRHEAVLSNGITDG